MKITTGNVNKVVSSDVVTFCIPNKAVEIKVHGNFKELERKLWIYLIHRAYEKNELLTGDMHQVSFKEVVELFSEFGSTKDHSRLWQCVKDLSDIKVSFRCGTEIEGFSSLLSCSIIDYQKKFLRYQIPRLLEEFYVHQDSPFSRIRTHFILGLKGKYSISLYLLLERYINRRNPCFEISIDELRTELKVEDGKLTSWSDFNKRVLKPSIHEILSKADESEHSHHGSGLHMQFYISKRNGNQVTHLTFSVNKTEKRIEWESKMKSKNVQSASPSTPNQVKTSSKTINLDWEKVASLVTKRGIKIDKYAYFDEWKDWIIETNKLASLQAPEFSYVGFLARKDIKSLLYSK